MRGWLNCNQVVMLSPGDNVLVDSGYCTHRERTLELLASREGLDRQPLERLVNTHCHSDHMGGNAAVASQYGCRITIPAGEVKHVDPWTDQSAWMREFDQRADPFRFDDTIEAGDAFDGGGLEWQCHAAPGHDMDALMFFAPRERILISGDALWRDGMGFVWPHEGANPFIAAAREALATIERLDRRGARQARSVRARSAQGRAPHAQIDVRLRAPRPAVDAACRRGFVFRARALLPGNLATVPGNGRRRARRMDAAGARPRRRDRRRQRDDSPGDRRLGESPQSLEIEDADAAIFDLQELRLLQHL